MKLLVIHKDKTVLIGKIKNNIRNLSKIFKKSKDDFRFYTSSISRSPISGREQKSCDVHNTCSNEGTPSVPDQIGLYYS